MRKNKLRTRSCHMIYLREGEAELQKTAEYVLRTIEDNLKSLVILFNEIKDQTEDSAETYNLQARLLTFACTTAEKLLLLNLYARNPLLLIGEKELKRDHLFRDFNYKNYDMNWLFNRSSGFVKPQVMWDTLSTILLQEGTGRLDDLETDFLYLKGIRNKYLHVFIIKVDPKSFYLVRDFVWVLLIRLFDALPSSLSVDTDDTLHTCGCDIDAIARIRELDEEEIVTEVLRKFGQTLNELERISAEDEKRIHLLKKLVSEETLNDSVPQYLGGEAVLDVTPEGEEVHVEKYRKDIILESEVKLDCPICIDQRHIHESGYLHLNVEEVSHREDSEGDYMIHEPPVDAEIVFDHFYCTGCGFYSDDYYLLEKLGYGSVLKTKIWFSWDINDGVGKIFEDDTNGVDILKP